MNAVLTDMHLNVLNKLRRVEQHELEERDFEEQLRCAEDDAERVRLCRRWSSAYEPVLRKVRTR